jgi:hypothetical protein
VEGRLQRSKQFLAIRGLNVNHHPELKNIFKAFCGNCHIPTILSGLGSEQQRTRASSADAGRWSTMH